MGWSVGEWLCGGVEMWGIGDGVIGDKILGLKSWVEDLVTLEYVIFIF